jgi:hypothetical protein
VILLFVTLLFSTANADLTESKDLAIASALVREFRSECPHIYNSDRLQTERMYKNFEKAKAEDEREVLACYQQQVSQVKAVHFLYKRLCDEVTIHGVPTEVNALSRVLVMSRKHRRGVRTYVGQLNDCLKEAWAHESYYLDYKKTGDESSLLAERLRLLKPRVPFKANRYDYR